MLTSSPLLVALAILTAAKNTFGSQLLSSRQIGVNIPAACHGDCDQPQATVAGCNAVPTCFCSPTFVTQITNCLHCEIQNGNLTATEQQGLQTALDAIVKQCNTPGASLSSPAGLPSVGTSAPPIASVPPASSPAGSQTLSAPSSPSATSPSGGGGGVVPLPSNSTSNATSSSSATSSPSPTPAAALGQQGSFHAWSLAIVLAALGVVVTL